MTAVCPVTGTLSNPDGSPASGVTVTFTPVISQAGDWPAGVVVTGTLSLTAGSDGTISTQLVAGMFYRVTIGAPGARPQAYRIITPVDGAAIDLAEMIAAGRYGWGPGGYLAGWGFGEGGWW